MLHETDIYDFMGWLTTRKERLVLSASDDAAPAADAVGEYLRAFPDLFRQSAPHGEPVTIRKIVSALEGSSPNCDDSPRWLAAAALRKITGWESATLPIAPPPAQPDVSFEGTVQCPKCGSTVTHTMEGRDVHEPDAQAEIERLKSDLMDTLGHWKPRAEAAEKERDELRAKLETKPDATRHLSIDEQKALNRALMASTRKIEPDADVVRDALLREAAQTLRDYHEYSRAARWCKMDTNGLEERIDAALQTEQPCKSQEKP